MPLSIAEHSLIDGSTIRLLYTFIEDVPCAPSLYLSR